MYAKVSNNQVSDVAEQIPADLEPEEKALWQACGDVVEVGWRFNGNAFLPPLPPEPPAPTPDQIEAARQRDLQKSALRALSNSDVTLLRCTEKSIAFPQEWRDYRDALRAIISSPQNATQLPAKPDYPQGS